MRDFSALPYPAKPVGTRVAGRTKLRLLTHKPGPNRGAELFVAICVTSLFVLCAAVFFCSGLLSSQRFHDNVYVNGVALGGMTLKDASGRFAQLKASSPATLQISIAEKTWTITAADINAHYSVDDTLGKALNVGHAGNLGQRLAGILSLQAKPQYFDTTVVFNTDKLKSLASQISKEAYVPGRDAVLQFLPATYKVFAITDGVDGRAVDAESLYELLQEKLQGGGSTVTVQTSDVTPDVTTESLRSQTELLASYTTALTDDAVRNNNINLAAQAISGTVLSPGEEFSFNGITGERTKEKGYVDAPAISNGKIVDAPGGGVCQVATTIYNAALLSGLDIVERHHHTWKMSYVDAGLDATVDYASKKDLRLKNSTGKKVYLVVRIDEANHQITANFYGLPPADTISLSTVVLEKIMPDEPDKTSNPKAKIGTNTVLEESIPGYTVDVFRIYTSSGDSKKELVSEDIYEPVRGRIEIGTKAPPHGSK